MLPNSNHNQNNNKNNNQTLSSSTNSIKEMLNNIILNNQPNHNPIEISNFFSLFQANSLCSPPSLSPKSSHSFSSASRTNKTPSSALEARLLSGQNSKSCLELERLILSILESNRLALDSLKNGRVLGESKKCSSFTLMDKLPVLKNKLGSSAIQNLAHSKFEKNVSSFPCSVNKEINNSLNNCSFKGISFLFSSSFLNFAR